MNARDFLASEMIISRANVLIRGRFEDVPLIQRLFYHNTVHTNGVMQRALGIAGAMHLPGRWVMLTQVASAFHDTVQKWDQVQKDDGVIVRQRRTGRNEMESVQEAVDAMTNAAPELVFSPEEYGIVASAIIATIPAWSVEHSTLIQPFLTPCSHPVVRAVALADVGSPGMDPEGFVKDTSTLFAEEQLDIMEAISKASRASDIDDATQEQYRKRYVSWIGAQVVFALGRQALLDSELRGLDCKARIRVKALFSRFDQSVEIANLARVRAMTIEFVPLMRQLLPQAFPGEGR